MGSHTLYDVNAGLTGLSSQKGCPDYTPGLAAWFLITISSLVLRGATWGLQFRVWVDRALANSRLTAAELWNYICSKIGCSVSLLEPMDCGPQGSPVHGIQTAVMNKVCHFQLDDCQNPELMTHTNYWCKQSCSSLLCRLSDLYSILPSRSCSQPPPTSQGLNLKVVRPWLLTVVFYWHVHFSV